MNPAYFVFILAVVIILILFYSIRSYRRYQENLALTFMECGFFEVPQPDDEIKIALQGPFAPNLGKSSNRRRIIGKAFRYSTGGMELYLFDPEPSESNNRTMVIRSSQLTLPKFAISPKIPLGGKLGSFINVLCEKIISRQLPSTRLNLSPEFESRYFLFGKEPSEVKKVFDDRLLRWLESSDKRFMISADGKIFTLSYFEASNLTRLRRRRPLDGDYIREMVTVAKEVYQNLYSSCRDNQAVSA